MTNLLCYGIVQVLVALFLTTPPPLHAASCIMQALGWRTPAGLGGPHRQAQIRCVPKVVWQQHVPAVSQQQVEENGVTADGCCARPWGPG
jgi:hypothetical protein